MKTNNSGCVTTLVILLIFGLIGGGLSVWGWTILQDARASQSWPAVQGTVTISRVNFSTDSDGGDSYSPVVKYRYRLNDDIYENDLIKFGENSYGNQRTAEQIIAKYPTGSQVSVYYDPEKPTTSVLEPGVSAGSYLVLGLGLFFLAITLFTVPFRLLALRNQ